MWSKNIFILFFVSFLAGDFAFAQQDTIKADSTDLTDIADTTHLYENIETYSKRSKFARLMYSLFFKPALPVSNIKKVRKKGYTNLIQKPYSSFEGKIIRNIDITTLDPFGYSTTDTLVKTQNLLYRVGNNTHIKTRTITIRNLLLFRKDEPFKTLLVKESERLIRNQTYVHEVSFYIVAAGEKSDSVDIFIRELDRWSIIPAGSISTSGMRIDFTEKNFLGSGHEFQNVFARNFTNEISSFNTNYSIPNIRNSYISSNLRFGLDGYGNFNRSLTVHRPFFSPLAKWAAGAFVASQYKKDSLKDMNSVYVPVNLKFSTQDFWAGKAQQIFKDNMKEEFVTNLTFTSRYLRVRYYEKPSELIDTLQIYSSQDFYSASIGISTRKYVQDKYIFSYGIIEDVPVGNVFELTGGYQVKNNSGRNYLGMRFSFGNYNKWGYLSSNFEYGTFFHAKTAEQGVINAGVNYFTGLFEIGRWNIRQFVKPQVTIGVNRPPNDSLTLNEGYGLDGFNSTVLSGTDRLLLTLQTQSYPPWSLIGFRFGPFLTCSLGMLGDAFTGFKKSRVYSQIGLGVLIKNENMVFNKFQISISFYPSIPGRGRDVFKINSFKTTDFGFRDFEIGKPAITIYD